MEASMRALAFDGNGTPVEGFGLKNGHYKHDEPFGHQSIDLGAVYYLASSARPAGNQPSFCLRGLRRGPRSTTCEGRLFWRRTARLIRIANEAAAQAVFRPRTE